MGVTAVIQLRDNTRAWSLIVYLTTSSSLNFFFSDLFCALFTVVSKRYESLKRRPKKKGKKSRFESYTCCTRPWKCLYSYWCDELAWSYSVEFRWSFFCIHFESLISTFLSTFSWDISVWGLKWPPYTWGKNNECTYANLNLASEIVTMQSATPLTLLAKSCDCW